MDWAAIPLVAELLGVEDVEQLIEHLAAIRDHLAEQAAAERESA